MYAESIMIKTNYDLCVIGGGINGAGIARDAAGRGLSVLLVEARDLASATSSSSTKLIHGGLRYLEYFEFRLVRDSLVEREKLLGMAPHIIRPMRFVLPHDRQQRPYWMIRLGLFLYDRLGGRSKMPQTEALDLSLHKYGNPLKNDYERGFAYSDCWVEDSRLVVLNALSAAEKGADIALHTACTKLTPHEDYWTVDVENLISGAQHSVQAKMVVNASGPWVRSLLESSGLVAPDLPDVRLVKGSHIIIDRIFEGDQAYIIQQPDKRIVFVIPYEGRYTLIGTTEEDYEGAPQDARISDAEIEYLCASFNRAFERQITKDDVIWHYSGVRPLFNDGQESATSTTRDYHFYEHDETEAPMISVFGGKLTTYRILAQDVVDFLTADEDSWTEGEALPGGDIPDGDVDTYVVKNAARYSWLPEKLLRRYVGAYGTRIHVLLDGFTSLNDLGAHYGDQVYECELRYLVQYEFAHSAADIVWRRSKLGLHISDETLHNIDIAVQSIVAELAGEVSG
jgi:glycerol-3-phosphate dehydrogenase